MTDTSSKPNWKQFRVLVVDDDADMRLLVEAVVVGVWPHAEVVPFDPLDEGATRIYDWSRYDLLILDYQLGNQSGLDWLRQYRGVPEFPPTVLITGAGSEEVAVKALKLGAVDYVRKGEGFQGRLVTAINEVLAELSERVSEQTDWARFLDHVESELAGKATGAMFYVVLDQFTGIKANHGMHIAGHILNVLADLVREELRAVGARVRTELHGENAVVALAAGFDQVETIEDEARRILDKVRKVRFRAGDREVVGTASVGVCLAEAGVSEPARLVARAEAACHAAMLRGGDQSYLGMLQGEIGEAVSNDQGIGQVWREDEDINDLLRARRLRTVFFNIRSLDGDGRRLFRAEPSIAHKDGTIMDLAELRAFQAAPGRRTFLDRVTISQSLRKLKAAADTAPETVFLRLSGESVGMKRFWTWLKGRLLEVPAGARVVFELAIPERGVDGLPMTQIRELCAMPGCQVALHGLPMGLDLGRWRRELPLAFHVIDMSDALARQFCDRVARFVRDAAAQNVRVLLTGINDTARFSCAFRAGASLLEGAMANEWEEMELNDGPEDAARWART